MMKSSLFTSFLTLVIILANAQSRPTKGWIDFGSSHANKWLQFSSQTMGPNALPVPYVSMAQLVDKSELEIGAHYHQMRGDTTLNSYFRLLWNVAPGKMAVEFWGCPTETFRMTNEVRDYRQVYWDDQGWITHAGDLWISTYIQLLKGKGRAPDLLINYSLKTTTGIIDHARYTDAPIHYFYLAAGKSYFPATLFFDHIRISGQLGFYVWQTNMVEVSQDEGPMYGLALKCEKGPFSLIAECSGYYGYDAYRLRGEAGIGNNDPLIVRAALLFRQKLTWKAEYQHGFRNYPYGTLRLSAMIQF
jgi:hypothetical protein